jgi:hypothetical protein
VEQCHCRRVRTGPLDLRSAAMTADLIPLNASTINHNQSGSCMKGTLKLRPAEDVQTWVAIFAMLDGGILDSGGATPGNTAVSLFRAADT